MKILIIRFSSLGDIILTTPVIRLLRQKYPRAEICYVTKKQFADVIVSNKEVNKTYLLEQQTIKELAAEMNTTFDLVVDLHRSLRSKLLLRELDFKRRVKVRKPYFKRWALVFFKINFFKEILPVPMQYMKTLKPLGIEATMQRPAIYPDEPGPQKLGGWQSDQPTIAIAPGAKWFTKRWPIDHFIALIEKLRTGYSQYQIVVLGGPDEKPLSLEIEKFLDGGVFDFIGKLTILETAFVISKADVLISNDSALIHIASAFETYIIALFLSTTIEFGFGPYPDTSVVLSQQLPCKPCDHKGRSRCPKGHFQCAYAITPDKVLAALKAHLASPA